MHRMPLQLHISPFKLLLYPSAHPHPPHLHHAIRSPLGKDFLSLVRESNPLIATIKDNKSIRDQDITVDLNVRLCRIALDTAKAQTVGDLGVGDLLAGDLSHVTTGSNSDGEVGKGGFARVDVASILAHDGSSRHLSVVGCGDGVVDEDERGAGVNDGWGRVGVLGHLTADAVTV